MFLRRRNNNRSLIGSPKRTITRKQKKDIKIIVNSIVKSGTRKKIKPTYPDCYYKVKNFLEI